MLGHGLDPANYMSEGWKDMFDEDAWDYRGDQEV
jgi:hypothetical protein